MLTGPIMPLSLSRPSVVVPDKLEPALMLLEKGIPMREITAKTGLARTTLHRHLPPREDWLRAESAATPWEQGSVWESLRCVSFIAQNLFRRRPLGTWTIGQMPTSLEQP